MRKLILIAFPLVMLAAVCMPLLSCSRDSTLPVTTTSPEARELYVRASAALRNFDYSTNSRLLERALELDSTFALAWAFKSMTLYGGNSDDFERAIELASDLPNDERAYIEAFYQNYILNDRDAAFKLFERLARRYPHDLNVRIYYAWFLRDIDLDRGLAEFEHIARQFPQATCVYNHLGYANFFKGDLDQAERYFQVYIDRAPEMANPYDSMGEFLRMQGRYEEAIPYFRTAVERDSTFRYSRESLIFCHLYLDQLEEAMEEREIALTQLTDASVYNHSLMIRSSLAMDDYEAAKDHFKEGMIAAREQNRVSDYAYLCFFFSFLQGFKGDYGEAATVCDSLEPYLLAELGSPMQENRIWDTFIQVKIYLALWQEDFDAARDALIRLKTKRDRFAAVSAEQTRQLSQEPEVQISLLPSIPLFAARTEEEQVTTYFRGLENFCRFFDAITLYHSGDYETSKSMLLELKEENPHLFMVTYYLALSEIRTENPEQARALFEEVLKWGRTDTVYTIIYPEIRAQLEALSV